LSLASSAPAGGNAGAAKKPEEKKPEEKKPVVVEKEAEPDLDLGGGGLFGDDF
jgi:ribosomal protein L12E/L44/L45/RPP1/RPP2